MATAKHPNLDDMDAKTALTYFCQKYSQRPVTKHDIVYKTNRFGHNYQAIVTLCCVNNEQYAGELLPTARDAERSAAQQAMMAHKDTLSSLSAVQSKDRKGKHAQFSVDDFVIQTGDDEDRSNPSFTPKVKLNSLCMKICHSFLKKGETEYQCRQVVGGYQSTVRLHCLPGEWSEKVWAGEVSDTKQAAEHSAAAFALQTMCADEELMNMANRPDPAKTPDKPKPPQSTKEQQSSKESEAVPKKQNFRNPSSQGENETKAAPPPPVFTPPVGNGKGEARLVQPANSPAHGACKNGANGKATMNGANGKATTKAGAAKHEKGYSKPMITNDGKYGGSNLPVMSQNGSMMAERLLPIPEIMAAPKRGSGPRERVAPNVFIGTVLAWKVKEQYGWIKSDFPINHREVEPQCSNKIFVAAQDIIRTEAGQGPLLIQPGTKVQFSAYLAESGLGAEEVVRFS